MHKIGIITLLLFGAGLLLSVTLPSTSTDVLRFFPGDKTSNVSLSMPVEQQAMESKIDSAQTRGLLTKAQSQEARQELARIVKLERDLRASQGHLDWSETATIAQELGRLNGRIKVSTNSSLGLNTNDKRESTSKTNLL